MEKYLKEMAGKRDRAIQLIESGECDPFDAEKVVDLLTRQPRKIFKYKM